MKLLPLRYDPEQVDPLLEALMAFLRSDEAFRGLRWTKASAMRFVIFEGFDVVFKRYGIKT